MPTARDRLLVASAFAFLAGAATIAGAWGFQIIGRYVPCELCYLQRIPYYAGVPAALLAWLLAWRGPVGAARAVLLLTALIFVASAALGVYHSGVEWHWWQGPASCSGDTGGDLDLPPIDVLNGMTFVSCTDAAWRFAGLSFAGWNAVISAVIALVALRGVLRRGA